MADGHDADEWDEWGDDHGVPSAKNAPPAAASAPSPVSLASLAASRASNAAPAISGRGETPAQSAPPPARGLLDWSWDLNEIDADLVTLPPSAEWSIAAFAAAPDALLCELASRAGPTRARLDELAARTLAMRAQAVVAKWNLLRLRQSLKEEQEEQKDETAAATSASEALRELDDELRVLAGAAWGAPPDDDDDDDDDDAHGAKAPRVDEMSSLLQRALLACDDGDVSPFQQAIEQLFSSLPDRSLRVPASWLHTPSKTDATQDEGEFDEPAPFDAFLARLVALCGDADAAAPHRVAAPSDAQRFQDAKDIQRDELVVNGERVGGAVGYDAVVAAVERHIRRAIQQEDDATARVVDAATVRHAAQQLLTACNRTESGGCAYEVLSQFVSRHRMDHVLVRPASAKAPPLEIALDVGAFAFACGGGRAWGFGLRARVSAVTWYCICDARDPTRGLYDVRATYAAALAVSLGLSPLAPAALLRRDGGAVTLTLVCVRDDDGVAAEPLEPADDDDDGSLL